MDNPFGFASVATLTSTTSSQTVSVPDTGVQLFAYNGAANTVYLKWAGSVALPTDTFGGPYAGVLPAGTTQVLTVPTGGGTLAYIANTAGGELTLATGYGA